MKFYDGSCYIGVAGPENDPGICRDSIHKILQHPGDIGPNWCRATKGYEARQVHLNKFIESGAQFILFLDHDMIFPEDTLERLRSHRLPYVSGLYMRREYQPIAPIWFKPYSGRWPLEPWVTDIKRGQLHEIGASGWGCTLLHRDVVLAVREKVLRGERDIIEDDMDIWPYDLVEIMAALRGLRSLVSNPPDVFNLMPALEAHTKTLERQIRPLRADHEVIGSDIRYPFYARAAGFKMMGDPDVRCAHLLNYPLSPEDFDALGSANHAKLEENVKKRIQQDRSKLARRRKQVSGV